MAHSSIIYLVRHLKNELNFLDRKDFNFLCGLDASGRPMILIFFWVLGAGPWFSWGLWKRPKIFIWILEVDPGPMEATTPKTIYVGPYGRKIPHKILSLHKHTPVQIEAHCKCPPLNKH